MEPRNWINLECLKTNFKQLIHGTQKLDILQCMTMA